MLRTQVTPIGEVPRLERCPAGHLGAISAAVTERCGGTSVAPFGSLNLGRSTPDLPEAVAANERRVLESLQLCDRVARLRLEHGNRCLEVSSPGLYGPADALLTTRPELILWLTVADCFPLILVAGTVRALGHCGWRGVAEGLVENLIDALARVSGLPPASQRAWIGPGIGPCCFQVGPEVAARFPESASRPTEAGRNLDLRGDILRRCARSGLPPHALLASPFCTSCSPDRFFSHRRDGFPSGRMAALCWDPASAVSAH
jgi:polyphenol oxidase